MTDIDLTPAVDAAARRLWIDQAPAHYGGVIRHAEESVRAQMQKDAAARDWDHGHMDRTLQNNLREAVLPFVWAAHRHIVRQAWEQGVVEARITPHIHTLDLTDQNPYADQENDR